MAYLDVRHGQGKGKCAGGRISNLVENIRVVTDPIIAAVANFVSLKDVLIALGILVGGTLIVIIGNLVLAMAPILLTVGAIIAVVALLRNAWENDWGGIQKSYARRGAAIIPIFNTIREAISEFIRGLQATGSPILAIGRALDNFLPEETMDRVWDVLRQLPTTFRTVWGLIFSERSRAAIRIIRPAIETIITTGRRGRAKGWDNWPGRSQLWTKIGPLVRAGSGHCHRRDSDRAGRCHCWVSSTALPRRLIHSLEHSSTWPKISSRSSAVSLNSSPDSLTC